MTPKTTNRIQQENITVADIGRLVRKRDKPSRRFVIVAIDDDVDWPNVTVHLQDLVFVGTPTFEVADLTTYEWIGEKRQDGVAW